METHILTMRELAKINRGLPSGCKVTPGTANGFLVGLDLGTKGQKNPVGEQPRNSNRSRAGFAKTKRDRP